jgi:hypothetical protein
VIEEAIVKIEELVQAAHAPVTVPFFGVDHQSVRGGAFTAVQQPAAHELVVHTLQAVADYLKENKDSLPLTSLVVHVRDTQNVVVLGNLRADRTRETFLHALPINPDHVAGGANKFVDQESFVLWVQTAFVDTPGREELLRTVGNLQAEKAKTLVDDGVTQEVTVKASGVRAGNAVVKHPILIPRRTFPEITLDGVQFVLRMRGGGDGQMPSVGLFEADGGAWRVDAIEKIAEHLHEVGVSIAVLS